jgi:hypothetical protein
VLGVFFHKNPEGERRDDIYYKTIDDDFTGAATGDEIIPLYGTIK